MGRGRLTDQHSCPVVLVSHPVWMNDTVATISDSVSQDSTYSAVKVSGTATNLW